MDTPLVPGRWSSGHEHDPMKFTLFSRLTLNYLFVFLLVLGGGVYMVYQLDRADEITHSILNVDRRLLESEISFIDSSTPSGYTLKVLPSRRKMFKEDGL